MSSITSQIQTNDKSRDNDIIDKIKKIRIVISQTSSSNSLIGPGSYNDKDIYLKLFTNSKSYGLLYEIKVYKNIQKIIKDLNISDFFVELIDTFELTYPTNSKTINSKVADLIKKKKLNEVNKLYGIITLNHSNTTLNDIIIDLLSDSSEESIYMLFFNLLYIIYLLNIKLKLFHHDLHFNNIIYVEEKKNIIYNFNKTTFEKDSYYTLRVFDYDYSYYVPEGDNPVLSMLSCTETFGFCNKETNKDLWTIIVYTILLLTNETISATNKNVLKKILKVLTNMSDNDLEIIIDTIINFTGIHRHKLCEIDMVNKIYNEKKCGENIKLLNITELIDLYYNTFLLSYKKKYLKYKIKYYMIKNILTNTN